MYIKELKKIGLPYHFAHRKGIGWELVCMKSAFVSWTIASNFTGYWYNFKSVGNQPLVWTKFLLLYT